MSHCINHPDRKAYSICHNCGKHYCEECLSGGGEYYYCNSPECRELRNKVIPEELIDPLQVCPNCNKDIKLSGKDLKNGTTHCPECEAFIDFNVTPASFKTADEFILLFSSMNQGDIALVISILEDGNFDYYITGQNFSSIDPLIQPARFYIRKDQFEEARELLKDVDFNILGISIRNDD